MREATITPEEVYGQFASDARLLIDKKREEEKKHPRSIQAFFYQAHRRTTRPDFYLVEQEERYLEKARGSAFAGEYDSIPDLIERYGVALLEKKTGVKRRPEFILDHTVEDLALLIMLTKPDDYKGGPLPERDNTNPRDAVFHTAMKELHQWKDEEPLDVSLRINYATAKRTVKAAKKGMPKVQHLNNATVFFQGGETNESVLDYTDEVSVLDAIDTIKRVDDLLFIQEFLKILPSYTFTTEQTRDELIQIALSRKAQQANWLELFPPEPKTVEENQAERVNALKAETGKEKKGKILKERRDFLFEVVKIWNGHDRYDGQQARVLASTFNSEKDDAEINDEVTVYQGKPNQASVEENENTYYAAVLPQTLADGTRIVTVLIDCMKYGNAAFAWRGEFGIVNGRVVTDWTTIFNNRYKSEVMNDGALRVTHKKGWENLLYEYITCPLPEALQMTQEINPK